ncbi:serine hydrolase domain-containing protein [Macrococcoides canis]|uniref:serine hydrolase domain-containing protein n=1 Tax=Macrococcoides canis TaxID=1855823 RepID=UPI0020B8E906|nr:serine hydrolase domain-containing protein [Macrococcus canis]UTH00752.1 beta-lactamase family protein [Macrococcus canis]UTH12234.1 beta-lactamase family protein [Macrococcus canis]WBF52252.1 beta-lactamase family protein [Macrococcus canis]
MKKFIIILFIIILWVSMFFIIFAQPNIDHVIIKNEIPIKKQLNSISEYNNLTEVEKTKITELLKQHEFNGSIFVMSHGKKVLNESFGYRDALNTRLIEPDDMYLIGSSQKLLTGILIKQLENKHKIVVTDNVQKYIPSFNLPDVTVQDLLLHRSGLVHYKGHMNTYHGLDASVQNIIDQGIDYQHKGTFFYNDANYILLAKIIENISHQSYKTNVVQQIFKPLRLTQSGFIDDAAFEDKLINGQQFMEEYWKDIIPNDLDRYIGAGNIYMSPENMGTLVNDFIHYKILDKAATDAILSTNTLGEDIQYRYGLYRKKGYFRTRGYFYGTDFVVWFNKDKTVVMATNKIKADHIKDNEKLLEQVFRIIK